LARILEIENADTLGSSERFGVETGLTGRIFTNSTFGFSTSKFGKLLSAIGKILIAA
jgi:hypothetical protein